MTLQVLKDYSARLAKAQAALKTLNKGVPLQRRDRLKQLADAQRYLADAEQAVSNEQRLKAVSDLAGQEEIRDSMKLEHAMANLNHILVRQKTLSELRRKRPTEAQRRAMAKHLLEITRQLSDRLKHKQSRLESAQGMADPAAQIRRMTQSLDLTRDKLSLQKDAFRLDPTRRATTDMFRDDSSGAVAKDLLRSDPTLAKSETDLFKTPSQVPKDPTHPTSSEWDELGKAGFLLKQREASYKARTSPWSSLAIARAQMAALCAKLHLSFSETESGVKLATQQLLQQQQDMKAANAALSSHPEISWENLDRASKESWYSVRTGEPTPKTDLELQSVELAEKKLSQEYQLFKAGEVDKEALQKSQAELAMAKANVQYGKSGELFLHARAEMETLRAATLDAKWSLRNNMINLYSGGCDSSIRRGTCCGRC